MRRTLLVLWASAVMVLLMGASALPAFAQVGQEGEQETESGEVVQDFGAVFVVPALLLGGAGAVLLRRKTNK
jgi:ABC-type nitrate/sulfonate/bicarbonate transport system permease component